MLKNDKKSEVLQIENSQKNNEVKPQKKSNKKSYCAINNLSFWDGKRNILKKNELVPETTEQRFIKALLKSKLIKEV